MADREITVKINGQEFVRKATDSAAGGLEGFASKIPGWTKAAGLIGLAFGAVTAVVEKVGAAVMAGIESYDRYAAAKGRLAAQAKLTSIPLAELNKITDEAKDKFGMGSEAAMNAAATVGKYAQRAGDATQANKLLASALDLGAASGLTAAETMEALEQGLRGQDEGFDKLLGKNPSAIWKDYADANGLAVGKMTDTQKRMAEMSAIMEAGNVVAGTYSDRMASGAGEQEKLNNRLEDAKIAFGESIQPVRIFVTQGLVALVEIGGKVITAVGKITNAVGVVLVGSFQLCRGVLGDLVEGFGKLTGSKDLEEWGRRQANAFPDFLASLEKMEKKTDDVGTATVKLAKAHQTSAKDTAKALKEQDEALERSHKLMLATLKMLYDNVVSANDAAEKLGPILQKSMEPARLAGFNDALGKSRALGDELVAKMKELGGPIPPLVKKSEIAVGDLAGRVGDVTGHVLNVAREFGDLDKDVETVIDTAGRLGEAVKSLLTGGLSFAGVGGIMSAVGGMVQLLQADSREQRQLQRESQQRLKENTEQVKRLTKEVGLLTLDVAGGEVATIEALLEDIVPKLGKGGQVFGGPNSFASIIGGATNTLVSSGLGWDSVVELGKKFGINVLDKNGAIDFAQLTPLLEALRGTNTAAPGKGFDAQLDILKTGFGVNQTSALDQLAQLFGLGGSFSGTLRGVFNKDDLGGSRAKLQQLFNDLAAGKLTEAQLGGLSGTQFLSLITDLIGRIDDVLKDAPATTGGGDGAMDGPGASGSLVTPIEELARTTADVTVPLLETMANNSERIAVATEGSWEELTRANKHLAQLIAVTDGRLSRLDADLAAARSAAALAAGVGPAF